MTLETFLFLAAIWIIAGIISKFVLSELGDYRRKKSDESIKKYVWEWGNKHCPDQMVNDDITPDKQKFWQELGEDPKAVEYLRKQSEQGRKMSEDINGMIYTKYGEDVFTTCNHCNKQIKVKETSPLDHLYPKADSKTMEALWCPHCEKKITDGEK